MSREQVTLAAACVAAALLLAPTLTRLISSAVAERTGGAAPVAHRMVAVVTAVGFAATALRFGLSAQLLAYLFLVALLVVLSFIDLATKTLPRRLIHTALFGGVLLLVPIGAVAGEFERVVGAMVGALGALIVLTVLHIAGRGGFGFGDVRLGAMLGSYLAWQGLRYVPVGLFLAFVLSALTGLALMALGRAGRRTAIPFGPFIALGAVVALIGGPALVNGA